jgi:hypothetical protein
MFQYQHIIHADFVTHSVCWLQRADLIWTHAVGDGMTALAYYLIPPLLIYATRKFRFDWALTFIFSVYAVFIFLCGITHIFDVVLIWHISEFFITFDGYLRLLTGLFSLFSVFVTLWALKIFVPIISGLLISYNKIKKEKQRFGAVSANTLAEHEKILEQARQRLSFDLQFETESAN